MKHLLNVLTTWRLMELIQSEDAPFDSLKKMREFIKLERSSNYLPVSEAPFVAHIYEEIGQAIECEWCLSVWVGIGVALATGVNPLYGFAYSAGALFVSSIRRLSNGKS